MAQYSRNRAASTFWKVVETIAVISLLATLAVMFVQVTSRYALGIAVPWTDETSRFLFVCAVFLGAAVCQRQGTNIRISVVLDKLSPSVRRWFEIASNCFTAVIALAVIVGSVEMAINTARLQAATMPVPYGLLYVVQGLSLCMMFAVAVRHIWCDLTASPGDEREAPQ